MTNKLLVPGYRYWDENRLLDAEKHFMAVAFNTRHDTETRLVALRAACRVMDLRGKWHESERYGYDIDRLTTKLSSEKTWNKIGLIAAVAVPLVLVLRAVKRS